MYSTWAEWTDVNDRLQRRRRECVRVIDDPRSTFNAVHFAKQRLADLERALDDHERHEMCRRETCPVCARVQSLAAGNRAEQRAGAA